MWNPELGVTLCFLLQARWVISGHFTHRKQKQANTGRPLPPLSTPSYSISPRRGCCQLALQELRSTSWLLSGGDAISAGSLIQLVIFGFLLLCGWARAHCLTQMNCPWQISQKPGSLPCLLLIQWKWTRPWSPLLVSDVSIPHLGVLHLFNKCWASYCVLDNTRLREYEYNKYGTCSQGVGSLDFSILLETSYPAILIVGCLKTFVSWWGWVFNVQGTQDRVLFFPLTSCVTSSKHDSVLGPLEDYCRAIHGMGILVSSDKGDTLHPGVSYWSCQPQAVISAAIFLVWFCSRKPAFNNAKLRLVYCTGSY